MSRGAMIWLKRYCDIWNYIVICIALSCPIKIVFFLNLVCFNKFNSYGLLFFSLF